MKTAVSIWRKQKKDKKVLKKHGTILTWTEIFVSPPKFRYDAPYAVVLVELDSKEKVYGQLVDFEREELAIGQRVVSVLRRSGSAGDEDVIEYGVKFKPVL